MLSDVTKCCRIASRHQHLRLESCEVTQRSVSVCTNAVVMHEQDLTQIIHVRQQGSTSDSAPRDI